MMKRPREKSETEEEPQQEAEYLASQIKVPNIEDIDNLKLTLHQVMDISPPDEIKNSLLPVRVQWWKNANPKLWDAIPGLMLAMTDPNSEKEDLIRMIDLKFSCRDELTFKTKFQEYMLKKHYSHLIQR